MGENTTPEDAPGTEETPYSPPTATTQPEKKSKQTSVGRVLLAVVLGAAALLAVIGTFLVAVQNSRIEGKMGSDAGATGFAVGELIVTLGIAAVIGFVPKWRSLTVFFAAVLGLCCYQCFGEIRENTEHLSQVAGPEHPTRTEMRRGCQSGCVSEGADPNECEEYCACIAKAVFDDRPLNQALALMDSPELQPVLEACVGEMQLRLTLDPELGIQ